MKCLIYVTKSKWHMFFDKIKNIFSLSNKKVDNDLNGKIVAEFDGEVEEIRDMIQYKYPLEKAWHVYLTPNLEPCELKERSCLTSSMLDKYKPNYAIHIKNLNIFDKSKKLREFEKVGSYNNPTIKCKAKEQGRCNYGISPFTGKLVGCLKAELTKAPQNMCYAQDLFGNKYVVISVRPEWACKILNGEKTIEVRKQVLNCMKGD